jgi:demethylmenaquinone methyltransferase/2-methoxy-6-polyprenyl-1,4-benzoquinol methylase
MPSLSSTEPSETLKTTDVPKLPPDQKARYVNRLFSAVAPTYDLLNTVLSFGLHKRWRKRATDQCRLRPGDRALDVATGTGDFVLELRRRVGPEGLVVGTDFCAPMLKIGVKKVGNQGWMLQSDALALPFPDGYFDAATMGFALRNVAGIQQTLNEMARVVRPGGRVVQLELSRPTSPLFRPLYYFYFQRLLPLVGKLIHGKKEDYAYLPASLKEFASREEVAEMFHIAGMEDVEIRDLTFGILTIYSGTKAAPSPGASHHPLPQGERVRPSQVDPQTPLPAGEGVGGEGHPGESH